MEETMMGIILSRYESATFTWDDAAAFADQYQSYATAILAAYVPAVFLLQRVAPRVPYIDMLLGAWNTLASALSFAQYYPIPKYERRSLVHVLEAPAWALT